MEYTKHSYWHKQLDALAQELSMLAIACDIPFDHPDVAKRILHGDESVCGRRNPEAFRKLRTHLMAVFQIEDAAIERVGAADTKEMVEAIRASIRKLRKPRE